MVALDTARTGQRRATVTRGERYWTLGLIAVGAALRVIEFLAARGFWFDENMILSNIMEKPLPALFGPLAYAQLAPAGFLMVERWCYELFGASPLGMRLWPLLCGLTTLILMPLVARGRVGPRAALLALGMVALSGDLIYYASELKPYSTDATATLAALLAVGWLDARKLGPRAVIAATVLGSALVWFSFPAVLVLGSTGGWRFARALLLREWGRCVGIGVALAAWAASSLAMLGVAQGQVGTERVLWRFWDIAFVPRPVFSMDALRWLGSRLAFLFANPLDTWTPLGYRASIVVPILLAIVGLIALTRKRPTVLLDLIGPIAAALAAASLRRYPFHGRLVLFLVPCLVMLIASGASYVRRWVPRGRGRKRGFARERVWAALVACLLLFPATQDLQLAVEPGRVRFHHPLGDLRPETLMPNHFP
jgi:hypothetical protein